MPLTNRRQSSSLDAESVVASEVSKPAVSPIPFLLREATLTDAITILRLARLLDSINLPTDKSDLVALIRRSQRSFRGKLKTASRRECISLFWKKPPREKLSGRR